MILNAGCKMVVEAEAPAQVILMLRPRSGASQWLTRDEFSIEPYATGMEFVDGFGNLCQRVGFQPGEVKIAASCTADTSDEIDVAFGAPFCPVETLPDDVLQFLLPSRYCQSDLLLELATSIIKSAAPGYDQVEAIRKWIQREVQYKYGASDASTSAVDTARERAGVCRDFSHLGIALCRAVRIPARMVAGYLYKLEPMDLHAWFEAYVGGRWYTFDATQANPRGNRIAIAYGRDSVDVALMSEYGPIKTKSLSVWVNPA